MYLRNGYVNLINDKSRVVQVSRIIVVILLDDTIEHLLFLLGTPDLLLSSERMTIWEFHFITSI